MASVKRKTVTRSLPSGATITTKKRPATRKELEQSPSTTTITEEIATWKDRNGKKRTGTVVVDKQGKRRVRTKSQTYIAKYRDGAGITQEVPTGCRDKQAAESRLAELVAVAEKVRAGSLTTLDVRIGEHSKTPVEQHICDYIADLRGRKVNEERVKSTDKRLRDSASEAGFRLLRDLNAEALRRWLRSQDGMSAATYNWHVEVWVAFGWWLTGRRIEGKRRSQTGERRMATNPFDGFGKKDVRADRKREARAYTVEEMNRLLGQTRRRPLEDALRIIRGPRKGELTATVSAERRSKLERLGLERALIYKTMFLTGLRLDEMRTLLVADLHLGDTPHLVLKSTNEKNRKGSSVPLRSNLAAELRTWTADKSPNERVFNVPKGMLRILNRDLEAAGIPKVDESKKRLHLHAMRHSTGTHLSAAGVSPRTAQAVMRHSDIKLTMNTYTDERLLDSAAAVEKLPPLLIAGATEESLVAPTVAPESDILGQRRSKRDKMTDDSDVIRKRKNPGNHLGFRGFF
ncbi:MAG TPA: integrase, partial [Planctomycetaceae bacterium]|nr:integrase [Planctomycetaceae bacterium]